NAPLGYQIAISAGVWTGTAVGFLAMLHYYPARLQFDRVLALRLLKVAWPAAAIEFIVIAYSRGSYFLLRSAGAVVQGEYAAADAMVRPLLSIAGAIFMSTLPTVALLAADQNFEALRRAYLRSIVRFTQVLLLLLAAAWIVAPFLLRRYAPEYTNATLPFRILSVGALFMFLNQLSTTFVVALGRFRVIMANSAVNLAVYLALATRLIPRYGAAGAAAATSIMEAINTIIQIVIVLMLLRSASVRSPREPVG
ncbi:MAG TPA: polysaccharide biosynthesis C-terminal domain-containing protein, partial [Vicinamibacterales bacterium]|nr:polysaccharide biosynthesis C-terminal domain-containing protein [Vicinamibacterales bacterium]